MKFFGMLFGKKMIMIGRVGEHKALYFPNNHDRSGFLAGSILT